MLFEINCQNHTIAQTGINLTLPLTPTIGNALYSVLINTLEAKITYYGSRLLFKFHY